MRHGNQQEQFTTYPTDTALGRVLNVLDSPPGIANWEYRLFNLGMRVMELIMPHNERLWGWALERRQVAREHEVAEFNKRYRMQFAKREAARSLQDEQPVELRRVVAAIDSRLMGSSPEHDSATIRYTGGLDPHRLRLASTLADTALRSQSKRIIGAETDGAGHPLTTT